MKLSENLRYCCLNLTFSETLVRKCSHRFSVFLIQKEPVTDVLCKSYPQRFCKILRKPAMKSLFNKVSNTFDDLVYNFCFARISPSQVFWKKKKSSESFRKFPRKLHWGVLGLVQFITESLHFFRWVSLRVWWNFSELLFLRNPLGS